MKKVLFAIITSHFVKLSVILLSFVFHSLSSIAQVPSYVPTSGLVGWWPFNGNANDESDNGNNGTVNGATLTSDRFGVANKAYSFDGSSSYIEVLHNSSQNLSNAVSFSLWINPPDYTTNINQTRVPLGKRRTINTSGLGFETVDGVGSCCGPQFFVNNNTGSGGLDYEDAIPLSTLSWTHLVGTYDGSTLILYKNSVLLGSFSNVLSLSSTIQNLCFGREGSNAPSNYFKGLIDDIGFWNRALTQQEISNLYTNSAPPSITISSSPSLINCEESATLTASSTSTVQPCIKAELPATLQNGLVGYWPFCGNANDASGNNNNGTVNGASLTTDRFGNANSAYSFDGNDWITIANTISGQINNAVSISSWVNVNSWFSNTYFPVLTNTDQTSTFGKFGCYLRNNGAWSHFGNQETGFGTSYILNTWYHTVFTIQGGIFSFYVNGQLILSGPPCCTINGFGFNNNLPLLIGKDTPGITEYSNGNIDDIGIWNRALTASEIQQLFNLGNVTYSWSTGATTPSITVTPTQTTSYSCTATNSSGSTTSSVTINVADTLTWTGTVDTDWHKPCNWSPQFVPKCCNNVAVPLTTNQPIVSGVAAAEDLTIYTTNGAQVTVNNGANFQIATCPTAITTTACPSLAVITTTAVSSITQTTAVSGGTISYQGASAIAARGVCWGTSPNPTIANSLTSNGTGIGTFTSNLVGLTGGTTYYVRAYATNGSGTSYGNQVSFVSTTPQPTYPIGSVFCTGSPTAIIDVTNPVTGKTWMDRNLGASQVATQTIDAAAYGDLYQWGRGNDGHQCRNSTVLSSTSTTDQPGHGNFLFLASALYYDWRNPQNPNLWQGVNGVNNPCPSGYRLPTNSEQASERISWGTSNNNSSGAFSSPLKWTMAGGRGSSLFYVGSRGYYWSSTTIGSDSAILYFYSNSANEQTQNRFSGFSVRCIKN